MLLREGLIQNFARKGSDWLERRFNSEWGHDIAEAWFSFWALQLSSNCGIVNRKSDRFLLTTIFQTFIDSLHRSQIFYGFSVLMAMHEACRFCHAMLLRIIRQPNLQTESAWSSLTSSNQKKNKRATSMLTIPSPFSWISKRGSFKGISQHLLILSQSKHCQC